MQVVDFIAKAVLITLAGAFMLGVVAGMAVMAYAVYRDFLVRDEYASLFFVGPHSRQAIAILRAWRRSFILVWVGALATGMIWILIHALFASHT